MRSVALAICLMILLAPLAAFADTTGALNGHLVDFRNQLPLANVRVHAISPSADRVTHTDSHGDFVLLDLPSGNAQRMMR
jgi:hypothetical protein